MAVKTARRMPDTYFELVKKFPLAHIQDDDHLGEAEGVLDRLLQEDLDEGGQQYLDALTDLIEVYEDGHHPIPDASEGDVLRELLHANRLSQQALARMVGISQSTISAVVNGNRSLTRAQVDKLAGFFHVSPLTFHKRQ